VLYRRIRHAEQDRMPFLRSAQRRRDPWRASLAQDDARGRVDALDFQLRTKCLSIETAVLFMFVFHFSLFSQSPSTDEKIIARAGETYITENEFLSRYELLPAANRTSSQMVEESKLALAYSLVAEKLLAEEALAHGLDKDSLFLNALSSIRKMLARDELYRIEVSEKVFVSDKEIQRGIAQAREERLLQFLFFSDKQSAEFVRNRIKTIKDFQTIDIDTSIDCVRDTATVIWGQADPIIEEAAYRLKQQEVSPVIAANNGFYILTVATVRRSGYFGNLSSVQLIEKVKTTIRLRKEEQRMGEYVSELLKRKKGYAISKPLKMIGQFILEEYKKQPTGGQYSITKDVYERLRARCTPLLEDTIVVVGDAVWNGDEVLTRLYMSGFPIYPSDIKKIGRTLHLTVQVWVWQELLGQEGIARGMDRHPSVQRMLQTWYQYDLANFMKSYMRRYAAITEADVWAEMKSKSDTVQVPLVQIREIILSDKSELQRALLEIEKGKSFDEVAFEFAKDETLRRRRGVSDFFPITERPPLGALVWSMNKGERSKPIPIKNDFYLFEVLDKTTDISVSDSSYALLKRTASVDALKSKQRRVVNVFLAQTAANRKYDIFVDRLSKIKVTHIPMMTYRMLGFGGRMFAVPPVQQLTDWMDIEPPKGLLFP
jgi:parvulin-like peptidyl-prolyl isomerase